MFLSENEEIQQRIKLSLFAANVIDNDRWIFSNSHDNQIAFSTFINKIIENFYMETNANFETAFINFKESYHDAIQNISHDLKQTDQIVKELFKKNINTINDIFQKYQQEKVSEEKLKFRLNKKVKSIIKDIKFPIFFKNPYIQLDCKNFIQNLLEEYCRLPLFKREEIFFKTTIEGINDNIHLTNILDIESNSIFFNVLPLQIKTDNFHNFNYLIGMSKQKNEADERYKIASFRISRITNLQKNKIFTDYYKEKLAERANELINKKDLNTPEFITGDVKSIKISFTPEGKNKYRTQLYRRPIYIDVKNDIYSFNCTEHQAFVYFSKFGKDAVILEPANLREQMRGFYKKSLQSYE